VEPLVRTTAALKLRVSMITQATAAHLRSRGLAAAAGGLGYIKSQPTADHRILESLSPRRQERQGKNSSQGSDPLGGLGVFSRVHSP
jgi:hypothetical protein